MAEGWADAVAHSGTWRDNGLMSWRRNIRGHRRVHAPNLYHPKRLRSASWHDMPGGGRRIQPLMYREWGDEIARDMESFVWRKYRRRPMVLGRGSKYSWDGGPVGRAYRPSY